MKHRVIAWVHAACGRQGMNPNKKKRRFTLSHLYRYKEVWPEAEIQRILQVIAREFLSVTALWTRLGAMDSTRHLKLFYTRPPWKAVKIVARRLYWNKLRAINVSLFWKFRGANDRSYHVHPQSSRLVQSGLSRCLFRSFHLFHTNDW